MQLARAARALLAATVLTLPPAIAAGAPRGPFCQGRYADSLSVMSPAARAREARPSAEWVYCLRAVAVYEHLSYGQGGRVRRQYHRKVRHGTGFAYRKSGTDWLLATNHHVTEFPEVTGEGVEVEGVPQGSRKVREEIRIVSSESDPDGPDQLLLSPVVADPALDLAVLASARPLALMPYRFGRSADLRVGNAVLTRGYPLGAFLAANTGSVIGVAHRDRERGWDHEDFAVDALLNLGSSGSPVFALSCETGEPELVGIYHAGYRGAQGLNVVVAIDQLRGVLDDLRIPERPADLPDPAVDVAALRAAVDGAPTTIPFAGRVVRVDRSGDALRYSVLDPSYPLSDRVEVSLVDPAGTAEASPALLELRDALRAQLALVLAYRSAEEAGRDAGALRDGIAGRIREREQEQSDLLAAIEAGAPGFAEPPAGPRGVTAGRAMDGAVAPRPERLELIRHRR